MPERSIERARSRSERLLDEIRGEFPAFAIRPKRASGFQRAIDLALRVVTLGRMRTYLTHYHTVLFGTLWVPESWTSMSDDDRYVLLRHERVHLRQRRRMGDLPMAFVYLIPIVPLGLAYGRARLEWEAYEETLAATLEVHGLDAAKALRAPIVLRFRGADYGWMWPFPRVVGAWFDDALERIAASHQARRGAPGAGDQGG
jgi:hypothetical protein